MGVSNLSDGTPLTYEWLNQLADAINKLEVQNSDDSNVKFVGLVEGDDVQVETGEVSFKFGDEIQIQKPNITFKYAFAEPPAVFASVYKKNINFDLAYPAAIGISNITATNFDAVVQTFKVGKTILKKGDTGYIRYVAIGKKQIS